MIHTWFLLFYLQSFQFKEDRRDSIREILVVVKSLDEREDLDCVTLSFLSVLFSVKRLSPEGRAVLSPLPVAAVIFISV
ncbi:MAG: hypothetical protein AB2809_14425 [Candidatus Thiodiazotropha sp.]